MGLLKKPRPKNEKDEIGVAKATPYSSVGNPCGFRFYFNRFSIVVFALSQYPRTVSGRKTAILTIFI